jgi:hypothetical protein
MRGCASGTVGGEPTPQKARSYSATELVDLTDILAFFRQPFGGFLGGVLSYVILEATIKRSRERRLLARALATEIGLNMQVLHGEIVQISRGRRFIPTDFSLSTQVYRSSMAKLGELPRLVMADVVIFYHICDRLSQLPKEYENRVDALRRLPEDSRLAPLIREEIENAMDVFAHQIDTAASAANKAQPDLLKIAFFPWSRDRRNARDLTDEEATAAVALRDEHIRAKRSPRTRERP